MSEYNKLLGIPSGRMRRYVPPKPDWPVRFFPLLNLIYRHDCRRSVKAKLVIEDHIYRVHYQETDIREMPDLREWKDMNNGRFMADAPHVFIHGIHIFQNDETNDKVLDTILTELEKSSWPEKEIYDIVQRQWRILETMGLRGDGKEQYEKEKKKQLERMRISERRARKDKFWGHVFVPGTHKSGH